jgi:hypothetical protein
MTEDYFRDSALQLSLARTTCLSDHRRPGTVPFSSHVRAIRRARTLWKGATWNRVAVGAEVESAVGNFEMALAVGLAVTSLPCRRSLQITSPE